MILRDVVIQINTRLSSTARGLRGVMGHFLACDVVTSSPDTHLVHSMHIQHAIVGLYGINTPGVRNADIRLAVSSDR